MYAIIEDSGSQRKVAQGDQILVDLLNAGEVKPGDAVTFDKVLVVGELGGGAKIGQPYVAGASVTAEVVDPLVKGEKIDVWKFREKKAWQRKQGHRQKYTMVKVTAING
ncbi:MAG: 50S ribosomal protein L21 [Phycisphaerae bacterium]|nr:50S ribosomal protein L21 [Phycisphaerales bacterium]MCK6477769.1 50S ribosomal protein L21 [Phycisphaerales bacterium]